MLDNAHTDAPQPDTDTDTAPQPDTTMAAAFPARLDGHPNAPWYFQSYDDRPERIERFRQAAVNAQAEAVAAGKNPDEAAAAAEAAGKDKNIQTFPGTFTQVRERLLLLNADSYAIAVGINPSDGWGRRTENIIGARAVFADLDGGALDTALALLLKHGLVPHLIVRSSPGKWHLYMLIVGGCPLDKYEEIQESVAIMLGSDRKVIGRQTVMRLPGFIHHKHAPVLSVVESSSDHPRYDPGIAFDSVLAAHPPKPKPKPKKSKKGNEDPSILEALERARLVRPGARRDGGVNVLCPWRDEHSKETGDTSTTYWPRGPLGDGGPSFKCLHDHCYGRGIGALCVWLAGQDETFAKARKERWQKKRRGDAYRHVNADESYWQQLKPRRDYRIEHFRAHLPDGKYICTTDNKPWLETKLKLLGEVGLFNADGTPVMKPPKKNKPPEQVTLPSSVWLDRFRPVAGVTWWPGQPQLIEDHLIDQGVWIKHPGARLHNEYRPSLVAGGDPREVERWLDLARALFPDDWERLVRYVAFCRQHPEGKINHALLLLGQQGIGKDMWLLGLWGAVGGHNWKTISPADLTGNFNPYLKSVVTQVNESREDEKFNRFRYYEALKAPLASPPNTIMLNEKNKPQVWVRKPTGMIVTSNHELDAIYLPRDDRRFDVAHSLRETGWKDKDFFKDLHGWYERGNGYAHVAAYLDAFDNSAFEPGAPPFISDAKRVIINASRPVQEGQLADVLDWLSNPVAVTVTMISAACDERADASFGEWVTDQANYTLLNHRFSDNGYMTLENPDRSDGRWTIDGRRQTVYVLRSASKAERLAAARTLAQAGTAGTMGALKQQRDAVDRQAAGMDPGMDLGMNPFGKEPR